MALTPDEIEDLITGNLASSSSITAEKHREVEFALLNLIKTLIPLAKGVFHVGNLASTDVLSTITFPDVGTTAYEVKGSFRSNATNYNDDNDVIWSWREPTTTSFKIGMREVSANPQDLYFHWEIKPL